MWANIKTTLDERFMFAEIFRPAYEPRDQMLTNKCLTQYSFIVYHIVLVEKAVTRTWTKKLPGLTGPPNSFTARGPVTLTAILFTQPAV